MSIDSPPRPARRLALPRLTSKEAVEEPITTPEPPRLPARRNPKWIAIGIVAICLGGLLSYVIYAKVATESDVVAMAATVYRGEVIEPRFYSQTPAYLELLEARVMPAWRKMGLPEPDSPTSHRRLGVSPGQ